MSCFDAGGGKRTNPVEYIKRAYDMRKHDALRAFIARIEQRITKWNAKRVSATR